MDSLNETSISPSCNRAIKKIEKLFQVADSAFKLTPHHYKVSLFMNAHQLSREEYQLTLVYMCDYMFQVPLQTGFDCGVHTVHNVRVAVTVSRCCYYYCGATDYTSQYSSVESWWTFNAVCVSFLTHFLCQVCCFQWRMVCCFIHAHKISAYRVYNYCTQHSAKEFEEGTISPLPLRVDTKLLRAKLLTECCEYNTEYTNSRSVVQSQKLFTIRYFLITFPPLSCLSAFTTNLSRCIIILHVHFYNS